MVLTLKVPVIEATIGTTVLKCLKVLVVAKVEF